MEYAEGRVCEKVFIMREKCGGLHFGLSRGRPRARAQTSWDTQPRARETPKMTV